MDQTKCMLCMGPLAQVEILSQPCTCGYLICRFCLQDYNQKSPADKIGKCPHCSRLFENSRLALSPTQQQM